MATFMLILRKWPFVICIFGTWERLLECLAEKNLAIGFLSWKSISILGMSSVCKLIERQQEVVGEET